MEVQRRRERDFGQRYHSAASTASCSWSENEYECDSLCTEGGNIEELKPSDGWPEEADTDTEAIEVDGEESKENNLESG